MDSNSQREECQMMLFDGQIWKRYDSVTWRRPSKSVLSGLHIQIEQGKLHLLIGEIGYGKSTLLKILANLETFEIVPGAKITNDIRYSQVSYMGQFIVSSRTKTIRNMLRMFQSLFCDFNLEKCSLILSDFLLTQDMKMRTLSDGQKRILAFAICLSTEKLVYLLDEPYSNIDVINITKMNHWLIQDMDSVKTFVIATHRIHEVELIADRILWIQDRSQLSSGEADALREEEASSIEEMVKKRGKSS